MQSAFADRTRPASRAQLPAKTKALPTQANILALTGTYGLISVNSRPVRDRDLAQTTVTFMTNGAVSVATACNFLTTTLQSRPEQSVIMGFGQTGRTLKSCSPSQTEAEAVTTRAFRDTANIARAGTSLTFLTATGTVIAQWTALPRLQAEPERNAPQFGAPPPEVISFGDYVLTEIGGRPIIPPVARGVLAPQSPQSASEAVPTSLPPTSQQSSSSPTLFLRANGQVLGGTGCNQYTSTIVTAANNTSRFGPIVTSKKACLNQATTRLEGAFFAAMRGATRIEINATHIELYARNRTRTARLTAINSRAQAGPSLYGVNWILRTFNNSPVRITNPPSILFTNSEAKGTTGCGNRFTIQHIRRNGASRFSDAVVTEMACRNSVRSDLQTRYMSALLTVSQIDLTPTTLTLRANTEPTVLAFAAE